MLSLFQIEKHTAYIQCKLMNSTVQQMWSLLWNFAAKIIAIFYSVEEGRERKSGNLLHIAPSSNTNRAIENEWNWRNWMEVAALGQIWHFFRAHYLELWCGCNCLTLDHFFRLMAMVVMLFVSGFEEWAFESRKNKLN